MVVWSVERQRCGQGVHEVVDKLLLLYRKFSSDFVLTINDNVDHPHDAHPLVRHDLSFNWQENSTFASDDAVQ